jgi:hypothetical protein
MSTDPTYVAMSPNLDEGFAPSAVRRRFGNLSGVTKIPFLLEGKQFGGAL